MNREEFKKELEERLLNFAVAMVKMSTQLPRNTAGFEISPNSIDKKRKLSELRRYATVRPVPDSHPH